MSTNKTKHKKCSSCRGTGVIEEKTYNCPNCDHILKESFSYYCSWSCENCFWDNADGMDYTKFEGKLKKKVL